MAHINDDQGKEEKETTSDEDDGNYIYQTSHQFRSFHVVANGLWDGE